MRIRKIIIQKKIVDNYLIFLYLLLEFLKKPEKFFQKSRTCFIFSFRKIAFEKYFLIHLQFSNFLKGLFLA